MVFMEKAIDNRAYIRETGVVADARNRGIGRIRKVANIKSDDADVPGTTYLAICLFDKIVEI